MFGTITQQKLYTNKKTLVVAFDIETSGPTKNEDIIGIGISAINSQTLEEVDSCLIPGCFNPGYFPPTLDFSEQTPFHHETFEFWSKHPEKLAELTYVGDSSRQERQKEMIEEFQAFRAKQEQRYFSGEYEDYELVADNHAFDAGILNRYIETYLPDQKPLPNTASFIKQKDGSEKQLFDRFHKTRSIQRGMLMILAPDFIRDNKRGNSYFPKIAEIYDVPKMIKEHDHNPANDAYTIAFEHCITLAIQDGHLSKR